MRSSIHVRRPVQRPLDAWTIAALLLVARRASASTLGEEAAEIVERICALLEREGALQVDSIEEWRYAVGMACVA